MSCQNTFRMIILLVLLTGVVSCQEAGQKVSTSVAPAESVITEPEHLDASVTTSDADELEQTEVKEAVSSTEQAEEVEAEQTGPEEEVVVGCGDKKLTMRHIEYLQPDPDSETIKKIAKLWLDLQLLSDEAIKRGIDKEPAVRFRADLRARQMYAEGLRKRVRDAVGVGEDQVRDYYEQNKETDRRINEPAKLSFTHVASKTLEESQAIFARVKAGEDIEALAKELSIDYDKRKSGVVGNEMETRVDKRFGAEFLNAVLYASEGEIIGPIKATLGMGRGERYEVVRFDGKVPGRIKSFEEVKDYIRKKLELTEQQKAVEDLIKSLEEKAADKIYKSERLEDQQTP